MKNEHSHLINTQETYFLETFPLIQQITAGKLRRNEIASIEDISQDVKLSLLIWKRNHPDRKLTRSEWRKFVNKVTQNKIKHFRRNQIKNTISLADGDEYELARQSNERSGNNGLHGVTVTELQRLVLRIWNVIKTQPAVGRLALLLKNEELTSSLIYYRGCRISEMSATLQLTEKEFDRIIKKLPLSDAEISDFLNRRFQLNATPAAIRKARQRAAAELRFVLTEKLKSNGKPSGSGKT